MVNTNLISSYRRELMAVAMFAILLTHMNCDFGCFAINRLALCGQGGVDAFFFLSGFGMYYSGMKKTTLTAFYKKRAVRIFPSFLAIFGIYMYNKTFVLLATIVLGRFYIGLLVSCHTQIYVWLVCIGHCVALCFVSILL